MITEYYKRLTNQQIEDKLESALNILIRTHIDRDYPMNILGRDNPFVISKEEPGEPCRYYTIPRKSLNCWLDKSLGESPYIFYGKVKLKVTTYQKDENEDINYLQILTKNKDGEWKFKASITRWGYRDNIDENRVYDIAILGSLNFDGKYIRIFTLKRGVKYRVSV